MTLEQLEKAKEIAAHREALMLKVHAVETADCPNAVFGFLLDAEMEEVLRNACSGELRRRAAVYEAELRELGVKFPGDPVPGVDPVPDGIHIRPGSWDPGTYTFTVFVPSREVMTWRPGVIPGGPPMRPVDEILMPGGLRRLGLDRTDVFDGSRPDTEWRQCGTVIGTIPVDGGTGIRVQLDGYWGKMRADVAEGRIEHVSIGYDVLDEEIVERKGARPLLRVRSWRLREVVLHYERPVAEAA